MLGWLKLVVVTKLANKALLIKLTSVKKSAALIDHWYFRLQLMAMSVLLKAAIAS